MSVQCLSKNTGVIFIYELVLQRKHRSAGVSSRVDTRSDEASHLAQWQAAPARAQIACRQHRDAGWQTTAVQNWSQSVLHGPKCSPNTSHSESKLWVVKNWWINNANNILLPRKPVRITASGLISIRCKTSFALLLCMFDVFQSASTTPSFWQTFFPPLSIQSTIRIRI